MLFLYLAGVIFVSCYRFGLEVLVTDTVRVSSHANKCVRVICGALKRMLIFIGQHFTFCY